jgi:predicted ArsR family transcriptional regulator
MISKEYVHTAQALLRITKSIADETIANRLMALAADYERRARKADLAEAAEALTPAADRAGSSPRFAKSN